MRPWTAPEVEHVRRLFDGGATDLEISIAVGRTPLAVRRIRQIHGMRRTGKWSQRRWSAGEVERLRELWADGGTDATIAAELERSERSVASKRSDLGLRRYRRDTRRRAPGSDARAAAVSSVRIRELRDSLDTIRAMARARARPGEIEAAALEALEADERHRADGAAC